MSARGAIKSHPLSKSAEDAQFYCPSSTYPANVILLLYFIFWILLLHSSSVGPFGALSLEKISKYIDFNLWIKKSSGFPKLYFLSHFSPLCIKYVRRNCVRTSMISVKSFSANFWKKNLSQGAFELKNNNNHLHCLC